MGNHLGNALDGMGYGWKPWPGNVNQKGILDFNDKINSKNERESIDCSGFVSAVAYVSGVTYEFEKGHGHALNGKDTMSADDIAKRDKSEKGIKKDGSYGGVQNMRYNSQVFIPTPNNMPIPGSIGMMKKPSDKFGLYSDHTYVVIEAKENKIRITESADSVGVQFSNRTHENKDRYWNSKTTFFQLNPNHRPGLIRQNIDGGR